MKTTTISFTLLFFSLLSATILNAEEIGKQLNFDVNPRWYNKGNTKVFGEVGVRKEFINNDWTRYHVKPSVAYALGERWTALAGLGVTYTDNEELYSIPIEDRVELAPYQGISYGHDLFRQWAMHYYLRLEERFDFNTQTKESLDSLRLRFRIRAIYKFNAYEKGRYFRLLFGWEAFHTVEGTAGQINEKSRATLGLERSFSKNQMLKGEVTWERQHVDFFNNEYSDIYLSISYYPSWGAVESNQVKEEE